MCVVVQLLFSCSVMSDTLGPYGRQDTRLSSPSLSPGVCQSPLSQWCIQPSHPLSPCSPPAPSLSSIRISPSESALYIRQQKYCSFSFSISPSSEYSGLISFRIDWFDLHAVQGTLKNLLQHLSSLWHSTLTPMHDYWKNHSFDYMDLCQQSDVSAF